MSETHEHNVAIVTGAGRGIGRAVAIALARADFSLCLASRTREELEQTRGATGLPCERALIVLADLASEEAPEALVRTALEHFGRIDALINNAGWAPARTPMVKMSAADLDRIVAVNLRAPIALARLAARAMAHQKDGGAIVNVASAAARKAQAGEAVYAAAKAGLVAFTHAAFAELRDSGVRIAVVLPGLVDTKLIPANKRLNRESMLAPDDVAQAIVQILNAPTRACPVEITIEPRNDPMRART